jgi:membrane fusion protein, copper/silver efflux system
MNRRTIGIGLVAIAAAALGAGGGWWWAHRSMTAPASETPSPGKKVLYWHDPMYPQHKFDKPGKSPFMEMQLVPVYGEDDAPASGVKVSPQLAQNLGVRTAVAERGRLQATVEAVGAVAFDERAVHVVQVRTAGYIEQLFVRAPLDPVRKGQPLARIFVPEWAGAQQEYLALKSSGVQGAADLARAARNRLLLLNMTEEQVQAVDREGKPVTRVTIASPADGIVGELGAREGMNVMPGTTLFRINGLGSVWVNVDVPEASAALVRPGVVATATVPAYPGEKFAGRIAAVLPEVTAATRTVRARVELSNPHGKLKPGMFATVAIAPPQAREAVLVPTEAVIVTGTRSVVVVDRGQGRFEPVDVEIGREEGGRTEILKGIEAGTRVVASGQFLIDSESSLRGVERRMGVPDEGKLAPAQAGAQSHRAEGKLEKVGAKDLTISHGPVPSIKWGPMTMDFTAPSQGLPRDLKPGDPITFEFVESPKGTYDITKIERRRGTP